MQKRLSGLVAATFTPMHPDGSLNLGMVPTLVDHLCRQGISGLYVVGSTGEGVSLTGEERRQVAEAYVRAAAKRIPVVVQVGHNSLAEAKQLASHAQQIGADAISATCPSYFRPNSAECLAASMAEVAGGAPDLPFYYYHIPQVTGVTVGMLDFLRVASERIPTLTGIKYTAPTAFDMQSCLEYADRRFDVLHGVDEMLLTGIVAGAGGAVGSTYNYAAPLYRREVDAFLRGDLQEARLWLGRVVEAIRVILRHGGLAGQKAVMAMIGLDCGPTRLPVPPLTGQEFAALREELSKMGYFDWIKPTAASESPRAIRWAAAASRPG